MATLMHEWFFMRPGFTTFRREPEKRERYLFGDRDREQRKVLLGELEGASFTNEGYKTVIYGDSGRGKTHLSHNLMYIIDKRAMPLEPIYIKCSSYGAKEPFSSFFKELILRLPSEELNRVAKAYRDMVDENRAAPLVDIVQFEDIATVLRKGLGAGEMDEVKNSMRWLGGETRIEMGLIRKGLQPHLSDSREFGAVMRGLAHMYLTVTGKILLYLVDEAERFDQVTQADTYFTWLAAMRELTEIPNVGFMFFVLAKTRNGLPTLFAQEEIQRRIGTSNYLEFVVPGREKLEEFLLEFFQTAIKKGEVPAALRDVVEPGALDGAIPEALTTVTGGDAERLKTFPFEPDAFQNFVDQVSAGNYGSKISEVLERVKKAAQRAMLEERRTINAKIVDKVNSEGAF